MIAKWCKKFCQQKEEENVEWSYQKYSIKLSQQTKLHLLVATALR